VDARPRRRPVPRRPRPPDESTLGSGALAGQTLGLDPQAYADHLGFDAGRQLDGRGRLRDFALEVLAPRDPRGHLSRLGEEIVLWATSEFAFARVGDAFSTGSSIMPQKRNPDIAELVRGKAGRVIGDLVAC
jgi:argininosuccinate lyase